MLDYWFEEKDGQLNEATEPFHRDLVTALHSHTLMIGLLLLCTSSLNLTRSYTGT